MTPMPVLYRLVGVSGEVPLAVVIFGYLAPGSGEVQHDTDLLRWLRQRRVYGRSEGVYQLGPAWIIDSECAATSTTEVPPRRAYFFVLWVIRISDPGLVDSEVLFPFYL